MAERNDTGMALSLPSFLTSKNGDKALKVHYAALLQKRPSNIRFYDDHNRFPIPRYFRRPCVFSSCVREARNGSYVHLNEIRNDIVYLVPMCPKHTAGKEHVEKYEGARWGPVRKGTLLVAVEDTRPRNVPNNSAAGSGVPVDVVPDSMSGDEGEFFDQEPIFAADDGRVAQVEASITSERDEGVIHGGIQDASLLADRGHHMEILDETYPQSGTTENTMSYFEYMFRVKLCLSNVEDDHLPHDAA